MPIKDNAAKTASAALAGSGTTAGPAAEALADPAAARLGADVSGETSADNPLEAAADEFCTTD